MKVMLKEMISWKRNDVVMSTTIFVKNLAVVSSE